MNVKLGNSTKMTARVRSLFVSTLVLGCAFGTDTHAGAQTITTPTTPNAIYTWTNNGHFPVADKIRHVHAESTVDPLRVHACPLTLLLRT
jgi:hypothetical protein